MVNQAVQDVTRDMTERSKPFREDYIGRMVTAAGYPLTTKFGCMAHVAASADKVDQTRITQGVVNELQGKAARSEHVGIITAYNEILSAHQPYGQYPAKLKLLARELGAAAQVLSGVPSMCDGVVQGQPGMEGSLISRDLIAKATILGMLHNASTRHALLGICDKISPGQLMGALYFGYRPTTFIPSGPMRSGISNVEKGQVRKDYSAGEATMQQAMGAEVGSYHEPGTCTFHGTANSNQMLLEFMGLQQPGSSFINPNTSLRSAMDREAMVKLLDPNAPALYEIVDEKAIVNGIASLMATGGSTNLVMHIIAIGRAAGIDVRVSDFDRLSKEIPLIANTYPNGALDINHFHAAGGTAFVANEMLKQGFLHEDVKTMAGGEGLLPYTKTPQLDDNKQIVWEDAPSQSSNLKVLTGFDAPFRETGGIVEVKGDTEESSLGEGIIKTSAVDPDKFHIKARAEVFFSEQEVIDAYNTYRDSKWEKGRLKGNFVLVLVGQGPKARGMPETHNIANTYLDKLQDMGQKVGYVTDGRQSGSSGKVVTSMHVSPEAIEEGSPLARIRSGDMIEIDANKGLVRHCVDPDKFKTREPVKINTATTPQMPALEALGDDKRNMNEARYGATSISGLQFENDSRFALEVA